MTKQTIKKREPWRVSLHGGHSSEFCDHGRAPLRRMVERAIEEGFSIYGVTEHAPRLSEKYLFPKEKAAGWDVGKLKELFHDYSKTVKALAQEYSDQIEILCGFEAEMVPRDSYVEVMQGLRERYEFDYIVASVHWVHEELILSSDIRPFNRALERCGGYRGMACHYFDCVTEMTNALKPEVIGHFDVIRRHGHLLGSLDEPIIRKSVCRALEAARENRSILDVNLAAYRRGFETPFPEPWIVREAQAMGVGLCFGDDSHSSRQVGQNLERARHYLLDLGVETITILRRVDGKMVRAEVDLT